MNAIELAAGLRVIHRKMSAESPRVKERLEIGPFDVTINPEHREEFASINRNRADAQGGGEPTERDVAEVVKTFASRGVERFFVWLGPGADTERSRAIAEGAGFTRVPWVEYPALARAASGTVRATATTLQVVRVAPGDARVTGERVARVYGDETAGRYFVSLIGADGFDHFVLIDGEDVVGAATLYSHGAIGYLGWASTRPDARGRGGQSALVAERVKRAVERGCTVCACETNTAATGSLRNLLRAGFTPAYAMSVFEYRKNPTAPRNDV